jgi:hypothetical protein
MSLSKIFDILGSLGALAKSSMRQKDGVDKSSESESSKSLGSNRRAANSS